jgi:hypothetical protein
VLDDVERLSDDDFSFFFTETVPAERLQRKRPARSILHRDEGIVEQFVRDKICSGVEVEEDRRKLPGVSSPLGRVPPACG